MCSDPEEEGPGGGFRFKNGLDKKIELRSEVKMRMRKHGKL